MYDGYSKLITIMKNYLRLSSTSQDWWEVVLNLQTSWNVTLVSWLYIPVLSFYILVFIKFVYWGFNIHWMNEWMNLNVQVIWIQHHFYFQMLSFIPILLTVPQQESLQKIFKYLHIFIQYTMFHLHT